MLTVVIEPRVDPDSPLMDDIKKLAPNPQHIHFSISFGPSFPFEPPFVRVVAPHISREYNYLESLEDLKFIFSLRHDMFGKKY